jgi:hypothetical protein
MAIVFLTPKDKAVPNEESLMAGGVVLPWSLGREAVETPAGLIGASAALPLFLPRMITSYETRCNYRAWFGHQATDPLRFAVPGYGSDQPMAAAISPGGPIASGRTS